MDLQTPPQPAPDADSAGFWAATAAGELRLCRCADCRRWHQPPLERCPACGGATGFELVSGCGRIKSFIVVRHPAVPGYLEKLEAREPGIWVRLTPGEAPSQPVNYGVYGQGSAEEKERWTIHPRRS